jgi:hypothetical protein
LARNIRKDLKDMLRQNGVFVGAVKEKDGVIT